MKIEELLKREEINFDGIELSYFLIGLLSALCFKLLKEL